MKQELQDKIFQRWPTWFQTPVFRHYGLEVGDGWFELIWKLCEDLEALTGDKPLQVLQVKEKFGELRFYAGGVGYSDPVHQRLSQATHDSYHVCELCGKLGEPRNHNNWIKVLCEACDEDWIQRRNIPGDNKHKSYNI